MFAEQSLTSKRVELFPHPQPSAKLFPTRSLFVFHQTKGKPQLFLSGTSFKGFVCLFFPSRSILKPRRSLEAELLHPLQLSPRPRAAAFLEKPAAPHSTARRAAAGALSHKTGLLFLAQQLTCYANTSAALHLSVTGFSLS